MQMERTPVIRVDNVTQRFRVIHERPDTLRELFSKFLRHNASFHDFDAVKNVSLEIPQGQMVGLIGRNGSGKSTLLKIIAGVYHPTAGSARVTGTMAPLIELGAGFHPELTGRENIMINGLLLGYSKREMQEREASIIEFAEIGEFIDSPVKQYSSGMYTRLAFAVATEVNPDILLLDEILAVGDASFKQKCFTRIEAFRQARKTIVFVTHDMQQIRNYCDRAVLLEKGAIMAEGDPEEVIRAYMALWSPEAVAVAHTLSSAPL
jgi:ABC-type polysaccharide/polyol phosphate transport system ATPase subunit